MKTPGKLTKKDAAVLLCCVVFALASLGAVGSTGRRRAKEALCVSHLLKWGSVWNSYLNDHDGYFAPRSGNDFPDSMIEWPRTAEAYYRNRNMLLCPEATRMYWEGVPAPFMAWDRYIGEYEMYYEGSYCVNLWVSNETREHKGVPDGFWRTPLAVGASHVPLLTDGQWTDADPLHSDEPAEFEDDIWSPNWSEIRRPCVNRHRGMVNGLFLDFSVRKIGLKQLWELPWHKNWNPDNLPPPLWPEWMQNFKDYWVE